LEAAGDKENRATSSATGVGAAVPAVATASTVKNSSTSTEQEPTSAAASSSSPLGDFLIVGCDGLWDVVDDQTAANFVWEQLRRGVAPAAVAPLLVQEALRRGTTDNVSVIVAFL
jgi:serine/threonine protein phosphatase PrpC